MAGRRRSIGIGVAVIVVLGICGWLVIVRLNVLSPLWCFAPAGQASMIDMFEADPLFAVGPEDGRLIEQEATTYECDNGKGGSPTVPRFANVTRLYQTPAMYGVAQLHQRFTHTATGAGWLIYSQKSDPERSGRPSVWINYCKRFGGRASHAVIVSYDSRKGPEVRVTLDAGEDGSTCGRPHYRYLR